MQTLADIPELVRCYPYNPQPKPQGKSGLHICQLVMELMEVTAHCDRALLTSASLLHPLCVFCPPVSSPGFDTWDAAIVQENQVCACPGHHVCSARCYIRREGICTTPSISGRSA